MYMLKNFRKNQISVFTNLTRKKNNKKLKFFLNFTKGQGFRIVTLVAKMNLCM